MALASLLQWTSTEMQDPFFAFEHFWSHQRITSASQQRMLHPGANNGGMWHRDHQQTHTDFPSIDLAANIEDYDLTDSPQRIWWLFTNHVSHLNAEP